MLYDVLPPTVFFLSLGAVVVLLSRVLARVRRADVAAGAMQSSVGSVAAPDMLGPVKGEIESSGSRWQTLSQAARRRAQRATETVRDRARRPASEGKRDGTERKPVESEASSEGEVQADVEAAAAGGIVPPAPGRWRVSVRGIAGVALMAVQRSAGSVGKVGHKFSDWRAERAQQQLAQVYEEPVGDEDVAEEKAEDPLLHEPKTEQKIKTTVVQKPTSYRTRVSQATQPRPASKKMENAQVGQSAIRQAQEAIESGDLERAEDVLVDHIMKHTKDASAYLLLGDVCMQREEWEEATEVYEQMLKWQPGEKNLYRLLGLAALKAGRYSKALEALQRAHEQEPDNAEVLEGLLAIAQRMDNQTLVSSTSKKLEELERSVEQVR